MDAHEIKDGRQVEPDSVSVAARRAASTHRPGRTLLVVGATLVGGFVGFILGFAFMLRIAGGGTPVRVIPCAW